MLGNGSGGREKPRGKPFEQPYALFDLTNDVSEMEDMAGKYPDKIKALESAALEIINNEGF